MVAFSAPVLADCAEDIEAIQLAPLQNGTAVVEDATTTPEERGTATYSKQIQDYLKEADAALQVRDEQQCLAMLAALHKMLLPQ
jgi:hypothetical protein